MISSKNKMVSIKLSKDTYDFVSTFAKRYNVSLSSFCQDCITKAILEYDKIANDPLRSQCSTVDGFYRKLAWFISETYDDRRK